MRKNVDQATTEDGSLPCPWRSRSKCAVYQCNDDPWRLVTLGNAERLFAAREATLEVSVVRALQPPIEQVERGTQSPAGEAKENKGVNDAEHQRAVKMQERIRCPPFLACAVAEL